MEIVPISKDSVVCLPKKLSHQLGGINAICLVYKITNFIHLMDVATGQSMCSSLYLFIWFVNTINTIHTKCYLFV